MPISGGVYVGGLRARLIKDSLYHMVNDSLTLLGWYDPTRKHLPVNFVAEEQNTSGAVEIPYNTIALAEMTLRSELDEFGSVFSEHRWPFFIDVFAENDTLGLHLSGDIKDIIEGRMPSIGRIGPVLPVLDWTMATPSQIFTCDIYNVSRDRAHNFPQPYLRHWYSVAFTVVDYYGDESR